MPVEAKPSHSGTSLIPVEKPTIFPSGKRPPQGPELLRREDPIQILSITPPLLGERGNNMAIRYVKDFEFPSAAGFTSSAPSKVTGPMFAKGGKVEKEPKGMMVIIGVGKPKGPMKKAEGSDESEFGYKGYSSPDPKPTDWSDPMWMENAAKAAGKRLKGRSRTSADMEKPSVAYKKGGKVAKVMHEFGEGKLHSGSKKGPKVTNPKQAVAIALSEAGKSKKGYAEGGMKAEQGVALPSPEKEMFEVYDRQTGDVIGTYGSLKRASRAVDRRDNEYGGSRYSHRPVAKAKGGKIDSVPVKDIKSGKIPQSTDEDFYGKAKDAPMPPRRPSMLKKGGMPHEDVKEDTALIKSMIKPSALKKAMGGPAVQMAKSNAVEASMKGQKKTGYADGGMASPLQQMGRKAVPVAPRAPMIPQQAGANGPRIGVGRSRSGKPDVGAIRAAMARAASQAVPENAPSMMKKGGKVGC
jgi:hypothetical protein